MANSVPSDKLVDLQQNAQTMDEFVNSSNLTTTARPTPVDPTGKVIRTVTGIDAAVELALQRIGVQYSDPITDWTPTTEITAFEAHRYPATTGDLYIPTAPLPFTTGATFDSGNWVLLQGLTLPAIISDTTIPYIFDTVADMVASAIAFPAGKRIGRYQESAGDMDCIFGTVKTAAQVSSDDDIIDETLNVSLAGGVYFVADKRDLYVESFRNSGDNDSECIIRALEYINDLPYSGTKLIFESGRVYTYSNTHYLYNINNLHIDLNGATLKRADVSVTSTTTVNNETVAGNVTYEVTDASPLNVGDYITAYTGNSNADTITDVIRIVGISGNTLTLASALIFNPAKVTLPSGSTIAKSFSVFAGRPSTPDSTTPLTYGVNRKIFITNGTIDGNSTNQNNNSWRCNTEILLHSNNGLIENIDFQSISNECIVGHGIRVTGNTFTDMSGSCFHLSVNDLIVDDVSASFFSKNTGKNLNLVGTTVNGHAEGAITFSWGAGRLIVDSNYMYNGNEGFLGHFSPSTGDNPDKFLNVGRNICIDFNSIIAGVDAPALGINITNNVFHDCGDNLVLSETLSENSTCNFTRNTVSGTTLVYDTTFTSQLRVDPNNVDRDFSSAGKPKTYITKGSGSSMVSPNIEVNTIEIIDSDGTAFRSIIADDTAGTSHFTNGGNSFGSAFRLYDPTTKEHRILVNGTGEKIVLGQPSVYKLEVNDDGVVMSNFDALYYGESDVDGSWRIAASGNDMVMQRRESGSWVTKTTFSA